MTLAQLNQLDDGAKVFVSDHGTWGFEAVFRGIVQVHETRFTVGDMMDSKRFAERMGKVRKARKAKIEYIDFGQRYTDYVNPAKIRYVLKKGNEK